MYFFSKFYGHCAKLYYVSRLLASNRHKNGMVYMWEVHSLLSPKHKNKTGSQHGAVHHILPLNSQHRALLSQLNDKNCTILTPTCRNSVQWCILQKEGFPRSSCVSGAVKGACEDKCGTTVTNVTCSASDGVCGGLYMMNLFNPLKHRHKPECRKSQKTYKAMTHYTTYETFFV